MMKIDKQSIKLTLLLPAIFLCYSSIHAQKKKKQPPPLYSAYLFVYFTGNDKKEEQIRFALSKDGYHYQALNQNQPVIDAADISETGGVRDPHILRGAGGKTFYIVATDHCYYTGKAGLTSFKLIGIPFSLPAIIFLGCKKLNSFI